MSEHKVISATPSADPYPYRSTDAKPSRLREGYLPASYADRYVYDPRPEYGHSPSHEPNPLLLVLRGYDREMRRTIVLESTDPVRYLTDLLTLDVSDETAEDARRVISRLAAVAEPDGKHRWEDDEDEEDSECARMGHDDHTISDDGSSYHWVCDRCGAEGWGDYDEEGRA